MPSKYSHSYSIRRVLNVVHFCNGQARSQSLKDNRPHVVSRHVTSVGSTSLRKDNQLHDGMILWLCSEAPADLDTSWMQRNIAIELLRLIAYNRSSIEDGLIVILSAKSKT